jgi:NADH-quinone oxidoreductase subunit L
MGGLKSELPITYWTFLVGTLAIAGVPLLSGFFSKDEILWQTFAHGHTILWAIGILTAFLTATYMFRLLYLAFFGERRAAPAAASHGHDDTHAHALSEAGTAGSKGHLHDAPPAMAIALVVLAIGSVLAGYVGLPNAVVPGGNRIEAFLEPSFRAIGAPEPATAPGSIEVAEPAASAQEHSTELALMGVSTVVALAGIGLAFVIYRRREGMADAIAARFGGLHRLLMNKYYVDEAYDAAVVQPIKRTSSTLLWRGVDAGLIDGTVNGVGLVVRGWSAVLRRLQTGSVRAYAMSFFVGVVAIVGYYLWR